VRSLCAGPVVLAVVLFAGCGGDVAKDPTTHPVRGKVVDRSGKPLTAGSVEFRPVGKSEGNSFGEIQADGKFTLDTVTTKKKLKGAQEGEHEVMVIIDPKGAIPPVTLKKKYVIKPGDNDITVQLE
jgi:hypothetical protein